MQPVGMNESTWLGIQAMVVTENDPGISIEWSDDAMLHACCGVPGSPVPQGATPAISAANMRAWFSALVNGIHPNAAVGGRAAFFHHLTMPEYNVVVTVLLSIAVNFAWGGALNAAGLSAGRFYCVTAVGRGMNHADLLPLVPFL